MRLTKEQASRLPPKPQIDDYASEEEFDECLGWWFHQIQPLLLGMSTEAESIQEVSDKDESPTYRYSARDYQEEIRENIKNLNSNVVELRDVLSDLRLIRESYKETEMDQSKLIDTLLGVENLYSLKFDRFEKSLEIVVDYSLDKLGYIEDYDTY